MAHTYKTEGIVLKRWDYKEQDRMLRILTKDFGKITTRAISARKLSSKLAGHLEPYIKSDFFIAGSRSIDIVAGSNTILSHALLRESLRHSAIAAYFTEIVDRATHERAADEELYTHVSDFFGWLSEHDANVLSLHTAILQLFSILGYRIELYECHQCKKPIGEEGNKFHMELWNVECEHCSNHDQTMGASAKAIKVLRYLNEHHFSESAKLHLNHEEWSEVHFFIRALLRYYFDRDLVAEEVFLALMRD